MKDVNGVPPFFLSCFIKKLTIFSTSVSKYIFKIKAYILYSIFIEHNLKGKWTILREGEHVRNVNPKDFSAAIYIKQ